MAYESWNKQLLGSNLDIVWTILPRTEEICTFIFSSDIIRPPAGYLYSEAGMRMMISTTRTTSTVTQTGERLAFSSQSLDDSLLAVSLLEVKDQQSRALSLVEIRGRYCVLIGAAWSLYMLAARSMP